MKKYALITVGFTPPTPEMMEEWMTWFKQLSHYTKDQIGFSKGYRIQREKVEELPFDENALTGMLVLEVENEDKALELAKACPAVTETQVYEIRNQNE